MTLASGSGSRRLRRLVITEDAARLPNDLALQGGFKRHWRLRLWVSLVVKLACGENQHPTPRQPVGFFHAVQLLVLLVGYFNTDVFRHDTG
ncbi:MAG TPA: hypothetical protein VFJ06_05375 [Halococcus sp.]|nr:hypothetical protein [Halococcus sp.]